MTTCATAKRGKAENRLSKADRDALVVGGPVSFADQPARGVLAYCRKLAKDYARRVLADRGRTFDADDLEGDALAAAVEAAKYYDPAAGTKFTSYVSSWIENALRSATDERRTADVRAGGGSERFDRTPDGHDGEDDDPEARYAEYGVDDLDADQRAAFDLLPPVAKRVVELLIAGHDLTAIELQLDMPGKDVRLAMRAGIDVLRKVGLVPADADPYPAEADRQAAAWEGQKVRNRAAADAERKKLATKAAARDRLVGQVRGLLLNEPGITAAAIARRLGVSDGRVGDLIREHGLRPVPTERQPPRRGK